MSLIQEALKRQAEETLRLPGQPTQPIEPPPMQQQPQPPQPQKPEKKKNKAFPIVPFILFLTVLLVVLLGLSIYLIKPKLKTSLKMNPRTVPQSEPVASTTTPAVPEPVKVAETPMQAIEAIIPVEPVAQVIEEPSGSSESMLKIKKTWPELKLTGIAQGGDRQRVAIINGKMLSAGRRLGDVAVIQVRENTVVVDFRGERRTLYIGE
jgi:hypothetical protein